jgi:alpha-mannosidase
MAKKKLFLVCNAHLDPVWLWEWQEGLAETLSTFRIAARFCEEFDGFAFCHNEALLYEWIEEYDPPLFKTIQNLIARERWYVIGGWYVQPDCNIPSGESFVRQALVGKQFFFEKLGTEPRTGVNFDPFGHTRGLVQILRKSGYHSYLFCRPDAKHIDLPADDFIWVGYDGSEILAHRSPGHYNSEGGKAAAKVRKWIENNSERGLGIILWGIGNHGGGPSREDLTRLDRLIAEEKEWAIIHGRPEDYFEGLAETAEALPKHAGDLNPWAVGCYTTMALVKQRHRLLENNYYSAERMLADAALQGLIEYPREELGTALRDLLFCEFHDILPGSSILEVEAYALQRMDHALEKLSRLRTKAFFALLSGEPAPKEGEFPIFVYNPHPYSLQETVVCEFQPLEPNFDRAKFLMPELTDSQGKAVPLQLEKESSNIMVDQRKRLVFRAGLKAASMNRFTCRLREVPAAERPAVRNKGGLVFKYSDCEVAFNKTTGLLETYRVGGADYLGAGAFRPLVIRDYPDPWGMKVRAFRDVIGAFELMTPREAAAFAGVSQPELAPVRVIEDGPVRTVVEALFKHGLSALCLRWKIPKTGNEVEVEVRVYWMEKDRMLKLALPTPFEDGRCLGQVAYGREEFDRLGEELVAQKWVGLVSSDGKKALTVANSGTYGFDFLDGELRITLLRSAAYSGHPVDGDVPIVPQDRFEPRIDQGERVFHFRINAGPAAERLERIEREAQAWNEQPVALCCHPSDDGKAVLPGVTLSDGAVVLGALKMAEFGERLIIRLFEPTGKERKTKVNIAALNLEFEVSLKPFEIKSLAVDIAAREVFDIDLLERRQHQHGQE